MHGCLVCLQNPYKLNFYPPSFRRAYTALIGETAIAFDFGPLAAVPKNITRQRGKDEILAYPLYILYENGETFLTYISLLHR